MPNVCVAFTDLKVSAYFMAELEDMAEAQMEDKVKATRIRVTLETRIMAGISPFAGILKEADRVHPGLIMVD